MFKQLRHLPWYRIFLMVGIIGATGLAIFNTDRPSASQLGSFGTRATPSMRVSVRPSSQPSITPSPSLSPCPSPTPVGRSETFFVPQSVHAGFQTPDPCDPYPMPIFGACQDEWDAYQKADSNDETDRALAALEACLAAHDITLPSPPPSCTDELAAVEAAQDELDAALSAQPVNQRRIIQAYNGLSHAQQALTFCLKQSQQNSET